MTPPELDTQDAIPYRMVLAVTLVAVQLMLTGAVSLLYTTLATLQHRVGTLPVIEERLSRLASLSEYADMIRTNQIAIDKRLSILERSVHEDEAHRDSKLP